MKRSMRWMALGFCLLLPVLFGCGGGTSTTTPLAPRPTVQLSPNQATLGASETQQFTASVTNADNTAVTWTLSGCTEATCGTISPSGLYTAPSLIRVNTTVTLTATLQADSKTAGSATVSHVPLSLEVSPALTLTMGAGATQVFTASVTRHPNRDVNWSLSGTGCTGDSCGTLTNITASSVTYNAPATVPNQAVVNIVARAAADFLRSQVVTINLMPVSVAVIPGPEAMVAPSGTRNFRAVVQYDPQNAGVTWGLSGCSGGDCGTLSDVTSTSVVYHAPATAPDPPTVTLMATSVTDTIHTAASTITVSSAISALQGKYAFLIRGYSGSGDTALIETMAGHFDADGNGGLVGVWDANRGIAVEQSQAITGSYAVQPDGRGTLTIEAGTVLLTFNLTVDATGAAARLAEGTLQGTEPGPRGSSGIMARQDPASFSLSSVNGDRVIALSGEHTYSPVAVLGRFTANPSGVLGAGVIDLTWTGNWLAFTNKTVLSGSFGAPSSSTGRGMASLTTGEGVFNFAYYIVSDRRILLVQTDARGSNMPTLCGEVRFQNGAGAFAGTSLNAPIVFNLTDEANNLSPGEWAPGYPAVAIGQILPNGAGSLSVTSDENEDGTVALNATASGSYAVEANGRVTLILPAAVNFGYDYRTHAIAYLTDQNAGFLMREGLWGTAFGSFEPQTGSPFGLQALSGTFRFNTDFPPTGESLNASGLLTLGEDGKVAATLSGSISDFSGTLNVDTSGRGVLTFAISSTTTPAHIVIWAISPEHCVALFRADPGYVWPTLVHLERSK